jgi:hypothetical protein
MRIPTVLIVSLILLAAAATYLAPLAAYARQPAALVEQGVEANANSPAISKTLIEPGHAVGPVELGDSRARVLELFPKKDEDQEWEDKCGTTIDWVDSTNPQGRGDLAIRINRKGKVFQIESSSTRFRTAENITTFDQPAKVAGAYKGLRAFALLTAPVAALGDRPLVFWVDKKKGVAFSFAFDPSKGKRYLYKIIVFGPGKDFCPEQETTSSPKWEEIDPYRTEPPIELSPER